jgi:GxxExxY protein
MGRVEPSARANELSHEVIGAAIAVHRAMGPGFLESLYEHALCSELLDRSVPFEHQAAVTLSYKGRPVGQARLDLLIDKELIVELKAVDALLPIHHPQVVSYLRATGLQLGLLINFNVLILKSGIKRIIA